MKTVFFLDSTSKIPKILGKRLAKRYPFQNPILSIDSLHSYWDIADINTLWTTSSKTARPVDGDPVGYVEDKSGNGHDFIQPTSSFRPIYRSGNGQPYLDFDGVSDFMYMPNSTAIYNFLHNNSGGVTYGGWQVEPANPATFMVFMTNSGLSSLSVGQSLFYDDSTQNNAFQTGVSRGVGGSSLITLNPGADTFTTQVNHLVKIEYGLTASNVYTLYRDSIALATQSTATANSANASYSIHVGKDSGVNNYYLEGRWYGTSIFETSTALSIADDAAVSAYLNNRMGI